MILWTAVVVAVLAWAGPSHPSRRVPWPVLRRSRSATRPVALSSALLVVAAQLRAGAAPQDAWRRALGPGMTTQDGLPSVEALTSSRGDAGRATAVVVAAGVAQTLGAPLAGVLEQVAGSVAADEEAAAELHAALAGPRATARVLAWLPALGLVVAAALGAHPVAVMLGGGLGTVSAVLGLGLLLGGRLWTRALLRRAGAGGAAGRPRGRMDRVRERAETAGRKR